MEYLLLFWQALVALSYAMAPYIVFGLLFAGILHELVPDTLVTKHLGRDNVASVVKSTLFGIPLPVCSCGVIPLATAIKKSGASHGATLSFLISTPITGVDSILATYGMFGWAFTLYRVATSMAMAMLAGILTNVYGTETETPPAPEAPAFSMAAPAASPAAAPMGFSMAVPKQEEASCCSSGCGCENDTKKRFALTAAMRYAFVTLLGDIAKPLFWGLLIGALITVAIPEDLGTLLAENSWLSYLIVIAVAVPMYVCATASLPIAAGLMLSGVSAGAAFVFLSAGPATNTVTIGVVKKMLGARALAIYLGTITVASVVFGLLLDWLFDRVGIDPKALVHLHEEAGVIAVVSSLLLWGLVLYFLVKPWLPKKKASCSGGSCGCE
jgi:uncharacterized membrane protein YraQ (UPF0718 family)